MKQLKFIKSISQQKTSDRQTLVIWITLINIRFFNSIEIRKHVRSSDEYIRCIIQELSLFKKRRKKI